MSQLVGTPTEGTSPSKNNINIILYFVLPAETFYISRAIENKKTSSLLHWSVWTAPASTISTPANSRRGVQCVLEVREPRRIISAVTGLTGSGSPGGPGVSAPSPALERTEF